MRTMHSISYALSKFDTKVYVISPDEMYFLPEFEKPKCVIWVSISRAKSTLNRLSAKRM